MRELIKQNRLIPEKQEVREMAGTVKDGQAVPEGMNLTDQSDEQQTSPLDQHEEGCPCEEESCCVSENVTQEKSESIQTPNISQALAATPLHTQNLGVTIELCWYCLKSVPIEDLNLPQMDSEGLALPSSGERVHYQRDPRPHFGVAHSSRSVSFPLWDCDRPREMRRTEEEEEEVEEMEAVNLDSCCPHCYVGVTRDTLRWHEKNLPDGLVGCTWKMSRCWRVHNRRANLLFQVFTGCQIPGDRRMPEAQI
ncbi:hypothetical protein DNTS_000513 [Danionella cerebrum]|uniref:Uncharacterized protein n=1 Tax=Danionella cerebrum TaxID=2873325 RepID=A0A553RMS9_9TELE|nr:hypothetical protein DNTS_000513 [Danionella translucida]